MKRTLTVALAVGALAVALSGSAQAAAKKNLTAVGAGVFSDQSALILCPVGPPSLPIELPNAIFFPSGPPNVPAIIIFDCTVVEKPNVDNPSTRVFSSGLNQDGTRYFVRVDFPTNPGLPIFISMEAGITASPAIITDGDCGAGVVTTQPVVGGYVLVPAGPPQ